MTPEEFREYGYRLIDWIADYRAGVEKHRVTPACEPGDIRGRLQGSPPEVGESFDAILSDLDDVILPGIAHWQHPRFFGYFPSNALLSSVLGDLASSGLGVIGLSWQSSPALTEVEEVAVDWVRQLVGLSEQWSGVIQDTASSSTLVALLCSRERATDSSGSRGGLQAESQPLIVYVSEQAHSSVAKAAILAGFGRDNIRSISTDADHALDPSALERAIEVDLAAGRRPCAVVATSGTTACTAFDPIRAIAEIARARGIWCHVDAAMAGSAMILPELRHLWEGIEAADSLVLNAHKWLGVVFDCSLYYIKDPQELIRVMSTNPSYLRTATDGRATNYRDWGIPLGRRFRALKLWSLLRCEGAERLRTRMRRDLENARRLAAMVGQEPAWRVVSTPQLQTICVRHEPPGLAGASLDEHTLAWVDRINRSGFAYLTPAVLDGRWMARISVGAESTERDDIDALWIEMKRAAATV
ncbi:MAG: pyridoxal-dependent decarboxylase [Isosphaeraceae bacterium]|nr:pyridoxal-dependent decarboxylase [Isosphaeraceae bacterium]